jgi:fermentation-respiration switch protein FrsA (DUF1100 family)
MALAKHVMRPEKGLDHGSLTLLVSVLALLLLAALGGCADKLILHPSTNPIAVGNATRLEIPRPGDGMIEVWDARSPGAQSQAPDALVLEFTGNETRAEQVAMYVASRWGDHAIESWTVNYPGYGMSSGPAQLSAIPPTALSAFDAISKLAAGRPIIVCGNSLGTTAALYVAANRHVAGLILQNPPPLQQVIMGHFGWWNLWLGAGLAAVQIPHNLDSIANARCCHEPALIFSSQHDDFIPPAYHRKVINAYAGPKRIVLLDGGHNGAADQSDEFRGALDWLWKAAVPSH